MSQTPIDPDTVEGREILRLFRMIKSVEEDDEVGSWPGADVVDQLLAWFPSVGIDPNDDPAVALRKLQIVTDRRGPAPVIKAGLKVWRLHWWDARSGETELFSTYDAALHALAATVHNDWADESWRAELPPTPDGLSDAQAVSLFYGMEVQPSPTHGSRDGRAGFDIIEEEVRGPEPAQEGGRA